MIEYKDFLHSLQQWSKELKEYVSLDELDAATRDKWRRWDEDIEKCNHEELNRSELLSLKERGEALMNEIKASKSNGYGNHQLPQLPYAYDALEPYISEDIMRLHHLVHHQAYVDGLNKAEQEIYRNSHEPDILRHWLREQAFNGSGHFLHTVFWENMTPFSAKAPIEEIARQINHDFGSFQRFKEKFIDVASSVQGPGWAVLAYDPINDRLLLESVEKHHMNHLVGVVPLLVLDVWEHAYYLQYRTEKKDYINAWWNIVNWQNVNERFLEAK